MPERYAAQIQNIITIKVTCYQYLALNHQLPQKPPISVQKENSKQGCFPTWQRTARRPFVHLRCAFSKRLCDLFICQAIFAQWVSLQSLPEGTALVMFSFRRVFEAHVYGADQRPILLH